MRRLWRASLLALTVGCDRPAPSTPLPPTPAPTQVVVGSHCLASLAIYSCPPDGCPSYDQRLRAMREAPGGCRLSFGNRGFTGRCGELSFLVLSDGYTQRFEFYEAGRLVAALTREDFFPFCGGGYSDLWYGFRPECGFEYADPICPS